MTLFARILFLNLAALVFTAGTVHAQDFRPPQPIAAEQKGAVIESIEAYLNDLKTFAADFEQSVSGHNPSTGRFFFKKPGRFLWHYLKPDPAKLVSGGGTIYFHDETSNQTTQVPRKGLADLLTQTEIDLREGNFEVENVYQHGGLLYMTVKIKDVAEGDIGGKLEMTFLQDPLQLRQITTFNQMNQPVEVLFYNIRENEPIPEKVFDFTPFHYREK